MQVMTRCCRLLVPIDNPVWATGYSNNPYIICTIDNWCSSWLWPWAANVHRTRCTDLVITLPGMHRHTYMMQDKEICITALECTWVILGVGYTGYRAPVFWIPRPFGIKENLYQYPRTSEASLRININRGYIQPRFILH